MYPKIIGRASLKITPSCFAEFLKLRSLAPLSLLDLSTCVGCRYELILFYLRSFSRMSISPITLHPKDQSLMTTQINATADFPTMTALLIKPDIHYQALANRHRPSPSHNE